MSIVVQDNGKIRKVSDIELAEKITDMRKKKDPWEVIDEMLQIWAKQAGDEVDAIAINVEQYKETMIDKQFGQTKDGKDFERRFQLAFPRSLMLMIRTQYKADELPFDRAFFSKFAKRYPFFKVAEK